MVKSLPKSKQRWWNAVWLCVPRSTGGSCCGCCAGWYLQQLPRLLQPGAGGGDTHSHPARVHPLQTLLCWHLAGLWQGLEPGICSPFCKCGCWCQSHGNPLFPNDLWNEDWSFSAKNQDECLMSKPTASGVW